MLYHRFRNETLTHMMPSNGRVIAWVSALDVNRGCHGFCEPCACVPRYHGKLELEHIAENVWILFRKRGESRSKTGAEHAIIGNVYTYINTQKYDIRKIYMYTYSR